MRQIKKILINAPNIIDYLNEVSQERFEKVCSGLSALKIKYQILLGDLQ